MFVSVIIPTFNRLELLKRAVDSVLFQSYTNYELIIVDDASSDETKEYLQTLSCVTVSLKENLGVSNARNEGVKTSSGEYIAFLDSDDVWEKDKLETQVSFHQQNAEVLCSFGIERWFRNNEEVKRPKKYKAASVVDFEMLLDFTFIGPSSVMLSKTLFEDIGGFDKSLAVCEDFDLWLRVALQTSLYLSEKTIIHKHAGEHEQLSSSVLSLEPYRIRALEKHLDRTIVKETIQKKLAIIQKGAIKHKNQELLDFVKEHHVI